MENASPVIEKKSNSLKYIFIGCGIALLICLICIVATVIYINNQFTNAFNSLPQSDIQVNDLIDRANLDQNIKEKLKDVPVVAGTSKIEFSEAEVLKLFQSDSGVLKDIGLDITEGQMEVRIPFDSLLEEINNSYGANSNLNNSALSGMVIEMIFTSDNTKDIKLKSFSTGNDLFDSFLPQDLYDQVSTELSQAIKEAATGQGVEIKTINFTQDKMVMEIVR